MKRLLLAASFAAAFLDLSTPGARAQPAQSQAAPCAPGAKLQYVCGVSRPEDLVQVPGSDWIIASGLVDPGQAGGGLTLIDARSRRAAKAALSPGRARAPFQACPGPLDPSRFSAHGLNIRPAGAGRATLYVVGHGGREAIEVFDVDTRDGAPKIAWAGCIPAPAGAQMNSVAALADGRVAATDFYHAPMTMTDALAGRNTGAVYIWRPGGVFEKLPGTDLPGPNGVEVSPDGEWLFVAVTGTSSVMRYDLAAPQAPPKQVKTAFRSDNLRWAPDGRLLLAGPGPAPGCQPAGASCEGATVGALDPASLAVTLLLQAPPEPGFPGHSAAVIAGGALWLGSWQADRVAYVPMN